MGAPVTYIGEPGSVALRICLGGQCLGRATDTTRVATLGRGVGHDKDPPRGLWDQMHPLEPCSPRGDAPALMKRFELLSILSLRP